MSGTPKVSGATRRRKSPKLFQSHQNEPEMMPSQLLDAKTQKGNHVGLIL